MQHALAARVVPHTASINTITRISTHDLSAIQRREATCYEPANSPKYTPSELCQVPRVNKQHQKNNAKHMQQ